ncbi:menaquinone-specific isochorismate synthase [Bacillus ectoiniformans]|uniref:isochorismate synthase n=1 Tax=Bacillus ectoiniformans TaxID=1494429 RepID=UPI0019580CE8|nr:isochorismate synthase [Bacillus ectoiniformans]MBM7649730.1 menaquinone-specific isochorismate synthase [Bacillus ectoiniformans]
MSTIKGHPMKKAFIHLIKEKQNTKQSTLFSYVEEVEWIDPLTFYHNGQSIYAGERFFWKDRDGELTLAGLGNIHTLRSEATDNGRYKEIEDKWELLMKQASIHNSFEAYGTGPCVFGGFSFDPEQMQEKEWSNFSPAFFYVPEFMLTSYNGKMYLTTNIICTPDDSSILFDKAESRKNQLLRSSKYLVSNTNEAQPLLQINEGNTHEWKQSVSQVVSHIQRDEELKKVVLARKITADFKEDLLPEAVLESLLEQQPDSFIFSFEAMDSCFLGASPERLVRKRDQVALSTCLAGSIRRGSTEEEDQALGEELLGDHKNLVEHDYVVQMIGEEMSGLCEKINIPEKPVLMKIRDIQHLYTPVVGHADKNLSILNFVEKLHPTPALGGLPTEKALEEIRKLEKMDRGLYAAPVGWMDYRKNGEFAVAIRSGLLKKKQAFLYAGCGVVEDSDAESEFTETRIKFRPMLRAIGGAERE